MNSINDFSIKNLNNMDIHTLRQFARQVGVNSPTSKKKHELVSSILDIITGKEIPEYRNSTRGRPAKNTDVKFKWTSIEKSVFADNVFSYASMQAVSPSEEYKVEKKQLGVLCKEDGNWQIKKYKYTSSDTDFYVNDTIVNKYKLKENDIVAYVKSIDGIQVTSVNGKQTISSDVEICGKKIKLNSKNILFVNTVEQKRGLLNGLESNGKVVFLPSSPEPYIDSPNILVIQSNYQKDEELINSFCASLDVALFYKSTGCSVSLVADNFLLVITAIKRLDGLTNRKVEYEVMSKLNSLTGKVTFIGIIPGSLKDVFTNLKVGFDNID